MVTKKWITIPATYEEYDENGEYLRQIKVQVTLYLGEEPPSFVVDLPLSETEVALNIGKRLKISVTDLKPLGIHVPKNFKVTVGD
jgi:hypothetical protein